MEAIKCPECPGELIPGSFSTIRVLMTDEDGVPVLDDSGTDYLRTTLRLPNHRVRFVGNAPDSVMIPGPEGELVPRNAWGNDPDVPLPVFDPTGLTPSPCDHGLAEHPAGYPLKYGCRTWIRAKYLDVWKGGVGCVVCLGQPRPDDLTTARNA